MLTMKSTRHMCIRFATFDHSYGVCSHSVYDTIVNRPQSYFWRRDHARIVSLLTNYRGVVFGQQHTRSFSTTNTTTTLRSSADSNVIGIPDSLSILRTPTIKSAAGNEADLMRKRWLLVPFATANHICLGSVFAWSMFNQPLMRLNGVVAPSSIDWSLGDVTTTFSLVMGGFAWGAVFSKYLDPFGPRACCLIGAASVGGGFSLAALASHVHSLPLLWLGGAVWGLGNGWAYIPPVATLMKWFPTRKGFAAGVVVVGYGSGALLAAPLFQYLLKQHQKPPEYLGSAEDVKMIASEGGKLFVDSDDGLREVVVATLTDVQTTFGGSIDPGVYVVGTGSTGVSEAFLTLGIGYAAVMTLSAFAFRFPPPGLFKSISASNQNNNNPKQDDSKQTTNEPSTVQNVPHVPKHHPPELSISEATRTKQFAYLYGGFTMASSGAYALIACSKLILSTSFPSLSAEQLTAFVAGTSFANLTGRLVYSNMSDYLAKRTSHDDPLWGRRQVYTIMWGAAAPLGYGGILSSIHLNDHTMIPETARLALFCSSIFLVISSFGGSAATRPAIVSDLFGDKFTAPLTARQLSGVLPAALLGPRLVAYFSDRAMKQELKILVNDIDEVTFQHAFGGASKANLDVLITNKTVTIPRVLELCPPGTVDPSPFVFDNAMLCAAALTGAALVCNRLTKPLVVVAKEGEQPHAWTPDSSKKEIRA